MALRTNLFPYPSAETTVGWISNTAGGVNIAQVNTGWTGTKGVQVTRDTGSGPVSAYFGTAVTSAPNADSFSVTPGEVYTFSLYMFQGVTTPLLEVLLVFQNDTSYLSYVGGSSVVAGNTWKRISVTGTVPAGATKMGVEVRNGGGSSLSAPQGFIIDGFLLEKSGTLGAYFDGSSSSPGLYYAWTGAANASASTETNVAPGATVLLDDNFDRANSTTVIGSPQTGPAPVVQNGVGGISGNQLYSSTIPLVATYDLGVTDVELSFTLVTATGGASVVFGYATGDYWYVFFTTTAVQVIQVPQSQSGVVMFGSTSKLPVNGSLCRAHLRGGTIRAYVDGVLVARWHPDAPITNTKHGVRINNTTARVDNLLGTDAPAISDDRASGERLDLSASLFPTDNALEAAFLYRGRDTKTQDIAAGA